MPTTTEADTIRILVATDNHVGHVERDPIRKDDSWQTFDEIMCLAKERDVDMVLLAGDLFHENRPSRKSLVKVMQSLRNNCLGEKPCELEMLSDSSEVFAGMFDHVNYEDPDINIAIPVFSIHGNHDDPSGDGHLAALDILQASGLLNYYGRTYESDNIQVKPVLLQKGRTKLALYGLSNVRDERLYRTFRDGGVTFFQPNTQKDNWFNLLSVHQNHHAYTESGYLPENFLPEFMDLVVWGHEHECEINPRQNASTGFHVMQPGSSIATSLSPGEAVAKHVAILSVTGKEFQSEAIQLKTVRPFVMKEIILNDEPGMKKMAKQQENRKDITKHLNKIVEELIEEANASWHEAQGENGTQQTPPKPLIRLRVEYSPPQDGGRYDVDNPQRFSQQFADRVANTADVVQFHKKKTVTKKSNTITEIPEAATMARLSLDNVKVEKLVREYLSAQSLTIFPQNLFGDAVGEFVDKGDIHAMEIFVDESLNKQRAYLVKAVEEDDDDKVAEAMDDYRANLEKDFAAGKVKNRRTRIKPKPDDWDSDLGNWSDQPAARQLSDDENDKDEDEGFGSVPPKAARGGGRGRGGSGSTRGNGTATRGRGKATGATAAKRGKKAVENYDEEEDEDIIMVDDDYDVALPTTRASKSATASRAPAKRAAPAPKKSQAKTAAASQSSQRQTQLSFASPSTRPANGARKTVQELSDDEISDDDAFEPAPSTRGKGRR